MVLNWESVGLDWTSGKNLKIPFNSQAGQSQKNVAWHRDLEDFWAFEPCRETESKAGPWYCLTCSLWGWEMWRSANSSQQASNSLRGEQVLSRLQFARSGPHWTTPWRRYKLQMLLGRLVLRAKLNSLPCFQHPACAMPPANSQKVVKTCCKADPSTPAVRFLTMQVFQITFFPTCFPALPPLSPLQTANTDMSLATASPTRGTAHCSLIREFKEMLKHNPPPQLSESPRMTLKKFPPSCQHLNPLSLPVSSLCSLTKPSHLSLLQC